MRGFASCVCVCILLLLQHTARLTVLVCRSKTTGQNHSITPARLATHGPTARRSLLRRYKFLPGVAEYQHYMTTTLQRAPSLNKTLGLASVRVCQASTATVCTLLPAYYTLSYYYQPSAGTGPACQGWTGIAELDATKTGGCYGPCYDAQCFKPISMKASSFIWAKASTVNENV